MEERKLTSIKTPEFDLKEAEADPAKFFGEIKQKFGADEIALIFGRILNLSYNIPLLLKTILEIDILKNEKNIDDLIDFLMIKTFENADQNDVINLEIICIKAISNYKNPKGIPVLLYCLNDKNANYKLRFQAAEALGKIGDKNAVESLINIVSDEDEKSVYLRESAAVALGMIGDLRAIDPFLTILEAKKTFLDKFTFLKERVIEALSKITVPDSKRVITAYKNALGDDSAQVRINALECLMNLGNSEAFELIKTKLNDPDSEVIKNAVIAIYNLKGKQALVEILNDPILSESAKKEAKEILDECGEDNE